MKIEDIPNDSMFEDLIKILNSKEDQKIYFYEK